MYNKYTKQLAERENIFMFAANNPQIMALGAPTAAVESIENLDLPLLQTVDGEKEFYLSLKDYRDLDIGYERDSHGQPELPHVDMKEGRIYVTQESLDRYENYLRENNIGDSKFSFLIEDEGKKPKGIYDYLRLRDASKEVPHFWYKDPGESSYRRENIVGMRRKSALEKFRNAMEMLIEEQEKGIPEGSVRVQSLVQDVLGRVEGVTEEE